MSLRQLAAPLLLLALAGCSGSDEGTVEPLGMIDFRPTAAFGFDAVITGLELGKQVVDERAGDNEEMRAQGYRYLFRQVEMNLVNLTADNDPAHPTISRCPSKNCKLGFDNPDYSYVGVMPLSADNNYRLHGDRGTAALILFQVLERADGPFKGTSKTHSEQLAIARDGSWVIYLGGERPEGVPESNFLKLSAEQATLLLRIAHNDWRNTVEPSVAIEVLDPVDEVVAPDAPQAEAVSMADLRNYLPADTPRVTGAERAAVLKERLAAINRRMNPAGRPLVEG